MAKYRGKTSGMGGNQGPQYKCDDFDVPFLCRDNFDRRNYTKRSEDSTMHGSGCECPPEYDMKVEEDSESSEETCPPLPMTKSLVPYNSKYSLNSGPPLKKSMSFLTTQELFSYRAIPALGVVAYMGAAVGTVAIHETYEDWLGSETAANGLLFGMTIGSIFGIGCYMYGRRHIRHAGAFQKLIYPFTGSLFFNIASLFSWAFIKGLMNDQGSGDYHSRCIAGMASGAVFLYTGRSYLNYVDHW